MRNRRSEPNSTPTRLNLLAARIFPQLDGGARVLPRCTKGSRSTPLLPFLPFAQGRGEPFYQH